VLCRPAIPAVKREGEDGEGISHPPRPAVVPVPDMGEAQPSGEAELPMTGIPGPPGLISGPPLPRAVHRRSPSAQGLTQQFDHEPQSNQLRILHI
jgi:hypothetical protein